jgi:hypothetical protein
LHIFLFVTDQKLWTRELIDRIMGCDHTLYAPSLPALLPALPQTAPAQPAPSTSSWRSRCRRWSFMVDGGHATWGEHYAWVDEVSLDDSELWNIGGLGGSLWMPPPLFGGGGARHFTVSTGRPWKSSPTEEVGRHGKTLSTGCEQTSWANTRGRCLAWHWLVDVRYFLHTLSSGFAKWLLGCLRGILHCKVFHVSYFCFCILLLESVLESTNAWETWAIQFAWFSLIPSRMYIGLHVLVGECFFLPPYAFDHAKCIWMSFCTVP